jgi:hypothetical protein
MTLKIENMEANRPHNRKRPRFEEEKKEECVTDLSTNKRTKRRKGKRGRQRLEGVALNSAGRAVTAKPVPGVFRYSDVDASVGKLKCPPTYAKSAKSNSLSREFKPGRVKNVRKQRLISIPKTIPREQQFFNKVVKPKGSTSKDYYFVLHYDHDSASMRLAELKKQGLLTGKREGRTRYKVIFEGKDRSTIKDVKPSGYEIVPSYIVTKTAMVDLETWDILE